MAYCKECGAYVAEGFEKCPACGKSVKEKKQRTDDAWDIYEDNGYKGGAAAYQRRSRQTHEQEQKTAESSRRAREQEFRAGEWQQESRGPVFNGEVVDTGLSTETKLLAACSYWGWLCLVPFFARRNDPYVRFHLNQGLVLAIAGLAAKMFGIVTWLVLPFVFIFSVIGFFSTLGGKQTRLPLIGDIRILK